MQLACLKELSFYLDFSLAQNAFPQLYLASSSRVDCRPPVQKAEQKRLQLLRLDSPHHLTESHLGIKRRVQLLQAVLELFRSADHELKLVMDQRGVNR